MPNTYRAVVVAVLAALMSVSTVAWAGHRDFGLQRDDLLNRQTKSLFGVKEAVKKSSTESISAADAEADPTKLITLADGLKAKVVSADAALGANIDMMALWPNDKRPTHIIACNEQGSDQPGMQRIDLKTGEVETILTGTTSCDPVHTTAWGTVVFGEENGSAGQLFEMVDPLGTTGVTYDATTGTLSGADAGNIVRLDAVGRLSYEGVGLLDSGVTYYGDENRPSKGTGGGAYFKFVPSSPWTGGDPISDLSESPLADGRIYGLRLGLRSGGTDYGQGTETGMGVWVPVDTTVTGDNPDLRQFAADNQLTGYYRPEDLNLDLRSLNKGEVRFCANNTGNEGADNNWGQTICVTDGTVDEALANTGVPTVQYFVIGTWDFAMMDNLSYQPYTGNWIIQEDGDIDVTAKNNDIWSCLEDGADVDSLSDACIRVATLNDLNAESTGGVFDATGHAWYVSIQHNVTGHGVILKVGGWR
jgi:secreted PhoX family phosphatase